MSELIIKPINKNTPYYQMTIHFDHFPLSGSHIKTEVEEFKKEDIDNNMTDFMKLIRYIYACRYSNKSELDDICYFRECGGEWCNSPNCKYYNKDDDNNHDENYFTYSHPSDLHDTEYKFCDIKFKYFDEENRCHDVEIKFSKEDIIKINEQLVKFGCRKLLEQEQITSDFSLVFEAVFVPVQDTN